MLQALTSDLRYAVRVLARNPAFTLLGVASLAIGIGFNTAIFSIVDAVLFRPPAIERPDQIVDVYTRSREDGSFATSSYPDYLDFRDRNEVFTDLVAYSPAIAALKAGERSELAMGEVVSGNYFRALGVGAAIGRPLLPEDDRPGAPRAVVISHRLWRARFASDPGAVGQTLHIYGQPYTIVGVAPASFTGMVPLLQPQLWLATAWVEEVEPAGLQTAVPSPTGNTRLERRGQRWVFMKGRLRDGVTAPQAEANLQVLMQRLAAEYPQTNDGFAVAVARGVRLHPEADKALTPIAAGLMLGVGLVLLIACANVTNMLLARASGRRKEIGIRMAVGASRWRLVRQLLTESLVLGALGAVAGVTLAAVLLRLIDIMPLPLPIPVALALQIDGRVLFFTGAIALLAGVVAGLAPALRATRGDINVDLKGAAPTAAGRRWTLGNALVAAQTAVTLVLLVTAALLTRSLIAAHRVDLGFEPRGLVALGTELSLVGYEDERASRLFDTAAERIRALPGVTVVGRTWRQPLAINFNRTSVFFPDRHGTDARGLSIPSTRVDEHYFAAVGVPLLRGRGFTSADTASSPRVAVVTEAFARQYFPGADAVGQRFRLASGTMVDIVGVVADYKVETVGEAPTPYIHFALAQSPSSGEVLMARTTLDPAALLDRMRREILALEPAAVFLDSHTMEAQVGASLLPARLAAQTLGLVGIVATALGAIGLYGVIAYVVARRTREIGVRMALGASPGGVVALIMRQGLTIAAAGLAAGAVLAWLAARAISAGLYGVSAADPLAWTAAIGVLLGAAALANYIPARRAARVDPAIALRIE